MIQSKCSRVGTPQCPDQTFFYLNIFYLNTVRLLSNVYLPYVCLYNIREQSVSLNNVCVHNSIGKNVLWRHSGSGWNTSIDATTNIPFASWVNSVMRHAISQYLQPPPTELTFYLDVITGFYVQLNFNTCPLL